MVHSLLGGPIDVYAKKGKLVLNIATSPSSTGIVSAVLAQHSARNEDGSQSFELSFYSQLEGLSCLGTFGFKLHPTLLKSKEAEKVCPSSVVWHASGNLLLVLLHGNLLLFGLRWQDKKHFNEEISFKEAILRSVQLNLEDSLITEILSVGITLQTSLKKLLEKQPGSSEMEYVTCVAPLRDGHSLIAGTNKGLYRVIPSWKDSAHFSLTLLDVTVSLRTTSSDSNDAIVLPRCAYKGFQGHVLTRVWEFSLRGVSLNSAMNVEEVSVKTSDAATSEEGETSNAPSAAIAAGQVEYTYSHIAIQQVHCLPLRGSNSAADLVSSSCVVAIQSDGSLTFSCLHSGDEAVSPGGSLPVLVSGHIHPVILTGYPLPRTLKAAKGLLYPCVYEKLCTASAEPVPTSVRPSFYCRFYVTEYDALVQAQSDIDAAQRRDSSTSGGSSAGSPQKKKVGVNGHCEEEISTVLAVTLSEYALYPATHPQASSAAPGAAVAVPASPGVVSCILTALVNTKHMPLAVRDLPVPAKTRDAASAVSSSGVVVDDRVESQSLVQWIVTVAPAAAHGTASVDFDCIQSVFVASQPCSRASESLKGTYTLNGCGSRLTALSLNGLITVRLSACLHVVTHCFDCHIYESSLLTSALGRLLLCHSTEGRSREVVQEESHGGGGHALLSTSIQTIPVMSPLESTQKLRFPSQQDGVFFNANSGHLFILNNLSTTTTTATTSASSGGVGGPVQYLSVSDSQQLRGAEESLRYDRIRVPKSLVEDVLMAQMVLKSNSTRGDSFLSTTGLIVACGGQVRTSYLSNGAQGPVELTGNTVQHRDYIALIPGGASSASHFSASKYVANCSVLYLLNRRTNKWRTTLLSIASTNTQKDLTMGSNAGAQVGKYSKARLIVQIPHINEVLDGHVNAELAAAAAATKKAQEAASVAAAAAVAGGAVGSAGLRLGLLGPHGGKIAEGVAPEGEGSRLRSNSFTSITSITSSAISHSHKYFLNKSRQLTNRTNSSIYSQITSSVAIALHGTHTIVLLTQRKSRYFLEIVSREASRESLSSGKPQPNVHQLIALPPGFLPLGMTTQDIVRLGGSDGGNAAMGTGGVAGVSASGGGGNWVAPSVSIDPDLLRRQSLATTSATVADFTADLDTAGSTHSSAVNHDLRERQVIGDKSCAVVIYSADGTFVAYSITTLFTEMTASTVAPAVASAAAAPKSPKTGGGAKVADFKVMELFTINVKQLLSSDAERRAILEPAALRKFTILPLNAPLFESQMERHQLFSVLSLPYVCLVLLSSSGTVYVADAYAKSVTVVPVPSAVSDITPVAAASWIGVSNASDLVEVAADSHSKCDVVYNDSLLLHCEDPQYPSHCSRHLWVSLSHTYPDETNSTAQSDSTSDYAVKVMSHNETDELFFANLHLTQPPPTPGGRGGAGEGMAVAARLLSVLVPLGSGSKPFGLLPVESAELFTMYLPDPFKDEDGKNQEGAVVGLRESLLVALILSLNSLRAKQFCVGPSDMCGCFKSATLHDCIPLFRHSADADVALSVTLLVTLHQAIHKQKKCASRFSYLLSCLEAHLRHVVTTPPVKHSLVAAVKGASAASASPAASRCPSAYQLLTSTLHALDPLLLVEIVSRLARRLEPALSKQLFPLCISLNKQSTSDGQSRTSGGALDIIELFEMCLQDRLLYYCNRLLSVTCEHFGGSESHLTTVVSLLLSLEHMHLSLSGDSLQLVSECLEFCHRLEELLTVHSGEILGGALSRNGSGISSSSGNNGSDNDLLRSRSGSVSSPSGGRRRRALSDSYVETVVQNALNQIRKKRNKVIRSENSAMTSASQSSAVASSSSVGSTSAPQGYYLGYGVMWLINTTASLFSDTPSHSTGTSASRGSQRQQIKSKDHNASLRLDTYKYGAVELLTRRLGSHAVNCILCGSPVTESGEPRSMAVNPSITMCLLMATIRELLSTSRHYASAALLLAVMLRQRTSLNWLHDHFDRHFEGSRSFNESQALGAEAKVRRILFILRLNKILTHGTRTAVYMALFNAEPPSIAESPSRGSRNVTQGIAYNAQYLRRLTESEKIHTQSHPSSAGAGGITGSFFVSTPRVSHDHTGNPTSPGALTPGHAAISAALHASTIAALNRWPGESNYFELPEDLLERRGALCAMDMLKALLVGLLLSGEEHCVYLLFKLMLPYMMMSESHSATKTDEDVDLILRELFVAKRLSAVETSESVSPSAQEPAGVGSSHTPPLQYFEVRDRSSVIRIFRLMIEGETEK